MSTPATIETTPAAYGERQAPIQDTESSERVMDNLSAVSERAVEDGIERANRGLREALERLDLQHGYEKTRLIAQHAGIIDNLQGLKETIAARKLEVVKSMDTFLSVTKNASIAAVDLVPVAPERVPQPIERHAAELQPPKFLNHDREPIRPNRSVTPLRRIQSPMVLLAIAVLAMVGVGVGVAVSQEFGARNKPIHAFSDQGTARQRSSP